MFKYQASKLKRIIIGITLILVFGIIWIGFLYAEDLRAELRKPTPEEIAARSGIEAHFIQRIWMERPGAVQYPCSNVGAVEFTFRKKAAEVLLGRGGWINVVIDTTADGGSYQWAVQNLYLKYRDIDELLSSKPVVDFSLGLNGQTCIKSLKAEIWLSPRPFEREPHPTRLFPKRVDHLPYLVGGRLGGGSALSDIPLTIGPWIGPIAFPDRNSRIWIDVDEVVKIDEGHMGCAPGAAARSISYLGEIHDFETHNPQDIYNDLVDEMDTDISGTGTTDQNMLDGKKSYTNANNLPIDSQIIYTDTSNPVSGLRWRDLIEHVQDALDRGCDVEILIRWSGGGGHVAMVTSVTSHADGSATINYVDDPNQGDGDDENQEHVIATNHDGDFDNGSVDGFMIECPSL